MRINGNRQILREIDGGPRQRWIGCFRKQLTCAKTFFHLHHLSFMPPAPPNLRPAGTSFQRKEGSIHSKRPTFSPLPLEGAVERSETGLAPPYVGNTFPPYRYPHHFRTSPFIKIDAEPCLKILTNANPPIESAFPQYSTGIQYASFPAMRSSLKRA